MKIIVTHSTNLPWKREFYDALKTSKLNREHEIILPQEEKKPEKITKELIRGSDLIIAEISYPSTGQGIELGWANIFNIPIMCVYKEGNTVSGALKYVTDTFIGYKQAADVIEKLSGFLAKLEKP